MDLKKTVPGSANARWRLQVEHQGHEALKKMLQLSSSTNKSINKRKKRFKIQCTLWCTQNIWGNFESDIKTAEIIIPVSLRKVHTRKKTNYMNICY